MSEATVTELPTEPELQDDPIEGVEFLKTGRVRIVLDGQSFYLRMPRLGEYRAIRQRLSEMDEESKALGNEYDDTGEMIKWVESMVTSLADRPITVPADDWPAWTVGGLFTNRLINHWRAVPLAPGASSAPTSK